MGHIRLGTLPKTRQWNQLIEYLVEGADVGLIASATMDAAKGGLKQAAQDPGLVYIYWLFTQIPLAAKEKNFGEKLRQIGLDVSNTPSLFEITSAFSQAVDFHLDQTTGRSDVSEIAQMTALQCLTDFSKDKLPSLFEPNAKDVQNVFKQYATSKQFSELGREFFAGFTNKYFNYFLSRELPNHIGKGCRFENIDSHLEFKQALERYCHESSRIVKDFSGQWFSKTHFQQGIDQENTAKFLSYAFKKLRDEYTYGGPKNG